MYTDNTCTFPIRNNCSIHLFPMDCPTIYILSIPELFSYLRLCNNPVLLIPVHHPYIHCTCVQPNWSYLYTTPYIYTSQACAQPINCIFTMHAYTNPHARTLPIPLDCPTPEYIPHLYTAPLYLYTSPLYLYTSPLYLYTSPLYRYTSPFYLYTAPPRLGIRPCRHTHSFRVSWHTFVAHRIPQCLHTRQYLCHKSHPASRLCTDNPWCCGIPRSFRSNCTAFHSPCPNRDRHILQQKWTGRNSYIRTLQYKIANVKTLQHKIWPQTGLSWHGVGVVYGLKCDLDL